MAEKEKDIPQHLRKIMQNCGVNTLEELYAMHNTPEMRHQGEVDDLTMMGLTTEMAERVLARWSQDKK